MPLDAAEKARRSLGYKNDWHRRPVDEGKQMVWPGSLRQDPLVAIIGGGLSGLMCASELARLGIRSVVFDTGKHGVGGRLATRASGEASLRGPGVAHQPGVQLAGLRWDHAAQFFTVTDPDVQALVNEWVAEGAVKRWEGPVGTLRSSGSDGDGATSSSSAALRFTPLPASPPRYVASGGMRGLAQHVAERLEAGHVGGGRVLPRPLVEFRRPVWVGRMQAEEGAGWQLQGEGRSQGTFDAVVIAHNGKCANRLVGPTGAPLVAQQLMKLRLNAVWALMVAFDGPVPAPFEGAFVQGSSVLSWAANNTRKMGLRHTPEEAECWTLFSTNSYGQANKVPQERVPPDVQAKVTKDMLEEFQAVLGLGGSGSGGGGGAMPRPLYTRVQLWGAALPLNSPGLPCVLDPLSRVGVCGDWLSGGSMQAAAASGVALARQLAALRGKEGPALEPFKLGLRDAFKPLKSSDIGEFPR